jgi:hypothetical protein
MELEIFRRLILQICRAYGARLLLFCVAQVTFWCLGRFYDSSH